MIRVFRREKYDSAQGLGAKLQAGFTFLEILIVIIILGLLAAMVAPNITKKLGTSKQKIAKAQIEMLLTALELYRLDTGRYPSGSEGLEALNENPGEDKWDGPYLKKQRIPVDPWDVPYVYANPGEHGEIDLLSYGLDGQPGGEGEDSDVESW